MSALLQAGDDRALEFAFQQFSQCSEELIATYKLLQEQVTRLTEELAVVRRAREQEMREKERLASRLDGLLGLLPAGVIAVDASGVVTEANPTAHQLLGEGLVGLPWHKVLSWSAQREASVSGEVLLKNDRWVTLQSTPLPAEEGTLHLLVEVTENHRLQEKLAQHKRLSAMGEMMAQLAHQIRTPLTAARLSVDCLLNSRNPERRERAVQRIESRLGNLEQLVNELLLFARQGEFEESSLSITALLRSVAEHWSECAGERVAIVTDAASGLRISGSEELLRSALNNLVHNAIEASENAVKVQLSATAVDDNWLRLEICDDGPGIPESLQERIFAPFFTTAAGGTGLGLAVTRAIVEAHGGRIDYRPGERGACFELQLPREKRVMTSAAVMVESEAENEN